MSITIAVAVLSLAAQAGTHATVPEVILSSQRAAQGDILLLRVKAGKGETLKVQWMERDVSLVSRGNGEWFGFLGVDLKSDPKTYPLRVLTAPSGVEKNVYITVERKDHGERRLTLPKEMVELDMETLERVKREDAELKAVLEALPSEPLWQGSFSNPVVGEISGPFGRRNIINGQPRSPHSGVDLKANLGAPVKAMNHGRVVFSSDQFFSGLSVVVDHGGGIHSMYFHLDKILVQDKQQVRKGDIIGQVGSTGRSTGPHLHLGIRVNGARVDPLRLISISKELE